MKGDRYEAIPWISFIWTIRKGSRLIWKLSWCHGCLPYWWKTKSYSRKSTSIMPLDFWWPVLLPLMGWSPAYSCLRTGFIVICEEQLVPRPLGCPGMLISSFEAARLDIWKMKESADYHRDFFAGSHQLFLTFAHKIFILLKLTDSDD